MSITLKATVMDAEQIRRSLQRIAHEVVERNRGIDDLVLVGIVSKGDVLAHRLAMILSRLEKQRVPFGRLDVTLHRDDLHLRPPPTATGRPPSCPTSAARSSSSSTTSSTMAGRRERRWMP